MPYQGSVLGHHIVLNYIDANGAYHTLQGVPQNRFDHNIGKLWAFVRGELLSDGKNNADSPFGRLQAKAKNEETDFPLSQPHTMVAEGDDLSARWALMQDFANEANSIGYEYRPISQNSNSFAGGALQRAGFHGPGNEFPERSDGQLALDPASGEVRSLYVPGFEAPLTSPINTATPMPFPLDVYAAPPSNGAAGPDRHGFRENGSGNWGAVPPSVQGAPDDKPVRHLGRRTYGLSEGSVVNPAAPAATSPAIPQGPLSLMDAHLLYRQRLDANPTQTSPFATGAPAAPLVPSDDQNFSGGLLGRFAAMAGVDPRNPNRFAPPSQDDALRGFYGDDPLQPWMLQRLR